MKRAVWLIVALVVGLVVGGVLHEWRLAPPEWLPSLVRKWLGSEWLPALILNWLNIVGQVFLNLIFMIVIPLIASALILGVYELGSARGFGRALGRTLLFTVITSTASVLIGVAIVNLVKPGVGVVEASAVAADVERIRSQASAAKPAHQAIIDLVPRNPVKAAANAFDGEFISFVVFCLLAGIALSVSTARDDAKRVLVPFLEQVMSISLKIVGFAMAFAPLAVFTLVLHSAFKNGFGIFLSLAWYAGCVVAGLLLQHVVVYSILLRTIGGRSPMKFYRDCREVYIYAFSTSSSNATLPKALETAETRLGIPPRIARFVLTVGATANQNGTALFEGITVLFLAQVYHVDLSIQQQLFVIVMSIIAGIGTAGVPGGSLPLIMILLLQVGVPPEGIGLILGVDRFLDMCRTVTNVAGDLVIAALVGRGEPDNAEVAGRNP
ncbi:MAG: dicarboxylate/amino acid:cation symporter [Phycisphaerales bacterium]|nr:dicarboxylate/amino acid:cation symporter [Phycisphaerales bacterium]